MHLKTGAILGGHAFYRIATEVIIGIYIVLLQLDLCSKELQSN